MSKPNWRDANPTIRRLIENTFRYGVPRVTATGNEVPSPATTWRSAAREAWGAGYDIDPPTLPCTERHAELAQTDPVTARHYKSEHFIEMDLERENAAEWERRRKWAMGPAPAEYAEQQRAERERAELEQRIEARAREILADEQRRALEKARAQARKELTK